MAQIRAAHHITVRNRALQSNTNVTSEALLCNPVGQYDAQSVAQSDVQAAIMQT